MLSWANSFLRFLRMWSTAGFVCAISLGPSMIMAVAAPFTSLVPFSGFASANSEVTRMPITILTIHPVTTGYFSTCFFAYGPNITLAAIFSRLSEASWCGLRSRLSMDSWPPLLPEALSWYSAMSTLAQSIILTLVLGEYSACPHLWRCLCLRIFWIGQSW